MQVTYPPEFHHFALRGDLTLASSAPLLNVFLVVAGKKITEGIAKTPMIESFARGGRKRLPKFKFSAKFPIGLHVILQIQIKKFENDCYLM